MMDIYKGHGGLICSVCSELAAYIGFSTSRWTGAPPVPFCEAHGPAAKRDWVVTTLEELSEFTKWKTKQRRNHPSTVDDATGLFDV